MSVFQDNAAMMTQTPDIGGVMDALVSKLFDGTALKEAGFARNDPHFSQPKTQTAPSSPKVAFSANAQATTKPVTALKQGDVAIGAKTNKNQADNQVNVAQEKIKGLEEQDKGPQADPTQGQTPSVGGQLKGMAFEAAAIGVAVTAFPAVAAMAAPIAGPVIAATGAMQAAKLILTSGTQGPSAFKDFTKGAKAPAYEDTPSAQSIAVQIDKKMSSGPSSGSGFDMGNVNLASASLADMKVPLSQTPEMKEAQAQLKNGQEAANVHIYNKENGFAPTADNLARIGSMSSDLVSKQLEDINYDASQNMSFNPAA